MNNKRTPLLIGIGLAVVLILLFAIPKLNDPNRGLASLWHEAGVECLVGGHSRAAQHFHPILAIVVDGVQEHVPANIGITGSCMAEIHTHDQSGTIHVETILADKIMRLKDFFTVWNQPIEREGYNLTMFVDGQPSLQLGELVLRDAQQIVLEYTSNGKN